MAKVTAGKKPDPAKVQQAELQIQEYARTVKFTVTEYSFEFITEKVNSERYYVPEYQRNLTWPLEKQSKFIESILMGLPIPFVFFWQDKDGRMEIVDGSQRLRTIRDFMANKIRLTGLETLPAANGLRFLDFSEARRFKFSDSSVRVIILDNNTDAVTRTEMFARINTGGTTATDAEIRRGSLPGPFMDLIIALAKSKKFSQMTPISKQLIDKREREELVTRFFAYLNSFVPTAAGGGDIPTYKEEPRRFYFSFVKEENLKMENEIKLTGTSNSIASMESEFFTVLDFIRRVSSNGFNKSSTGRQVPRVRFEAIAVGAALALRHDPAIFERVDSIAPLLNSKAFADATRSDAANVKSKLLGRINLVRNWLIQQ